MIKKRVRRLDVAISIKDAALKKLKNAGQFEETNFGPLLVWRGDELEISRHTFYPIFPTPSENASRKCYEASVDPKLRLLYGLDIWGTQGKVLNIMWDYNNHVELRSFKRGEWEEKLLHHI